MQTRARDANHLDFHAWIARREIEEQTIADDERFGIDRPPRRPWACRMKDWVARITDEFDAVFRDSMADRVFRPIAVGRVENVDLSVDHDRSGSTDALPLTILLRPEFRDLGPGLEVAAFGDAD